jgi:hypothetical protein
MARLDQFRPVIGAYQRTRTASGAGALRADTAAWNLIRDVAAKGVAVRDGRPAPIVSRVTYANSTRAQQQRVLNNVRRSQGAHPHDRSRFYRVVVEVIATCVKEIRGKCPSYSGSAGEYAGGDVARIELWFSWLFCPHHPDPVVKRNFIVKCLKALHKGQPRSSRDVLLGRLRMWAAYRLLLMAEADLKSFHHATGERSNELPAIRAARAVLRPHVALRSAPPASRHAGIHKPGQCSRRGWVMKPTVALQVSVTLPFPNGCTLRERRGP